MASAPCLGRPSAPQRLHHNHSTAPRARVGGLALIERRGARIATGQRVLRFVPISAKGNPLIVVDLLDMRCHEYQRALPM
jgi:hypothetical protein